MQAGQKANEQEKQKDDRLVAMQENTQGYSMVCMKVQITAAQLGNLITDVKVENQVGTMDELKVDMKEVSLENYWAAEKENYQVYMMAAVSE